MLADCLESFNFDDFERTSVQTIRIYDNHASKSPLDIFEVRNLGGHNIHNKEVIVFVLIRDIRDIITSVHPNVPDDYFIGYEASYRVRGQFPNYEAIFDAPGIGEIFREIQYLRNSGDYKVDLIRYEELIGDPDRFQEALSRKYDLSFKESFVNFHLNSSKHGIKFEGQWKTLRPSLVRSDKEVTTAYIGRWKISKHRQRIIQQFTQHPELFMILREYGYEQNDDWFQDLLDD
jgi:hypothetical protein